MIPSCLREATKIGVTIFCESEQKFYQVYIETDSLLGATRIINTYKPKRCYKVVKVHIEEVLTLVN